MNLSIASNEKATAEPELKRPLRNDDFDIDALSEWELARLTSKTWSMEQE